VRDGGKRQRLKKSSTSLVDFGETGEDGEQHGKKEVVPWDEKRGRES